VVTVGKPGYEAASEPIATGEFATNACLDA
jgi:hypothetical protein